MWPEGATSVQRRQGYDLGRRRAGAIHDPLAERPGGRVSSEIVDMTDMMPTLAAAAGEPDVVENLRKGARYGGRDYKLHLDGYDQTALLAARARIPRAISYFTTTRPC